MPGYQTLTDAFRERARAPATLQAETYPVIYFENSVEYRETLADIYTGARTYLAVLQQKGVKKGDFVILQFASRAKHFRAFWACSLGGIVPVTVAVPQYFGSGSALVEKILGVAETLQAVGNCFILTEKSVEASLRSALSSENIVDIFPMDSLAENSTGESCEEATIQPSDVLFLQLTSGSTGIPKCIQETHQGIIHQINASSGPCGYAEGKVSLNWLPFDHVVPMLTFHLRDVYLGMGQLQLPTDEVLADPLLWMNCLERFRVNFSWSPNFGYNLVNKACQQLEVSPTWDLASLEGLLNAGEQVTSSTCEEFIKRVGIPENVMQPSFGMAETCTCITYNTNYSCLSSLRVLPESLASEVKEATASETAVEFMDLGAAIEGVEIRIVGRDRITPVSDNLIGHFQIRGGVVTPGYINRPEANQESFVGDGWFDSGDVGFIRNGRLYLTGRHKENINIRGVNLYCYEIERQMESVKGVLATFSAATSVFSPELGTEVLLLFFAPDPDVLDTTSLLHDTLDDDLRDLVSMVRIRVTQTIGIAPKECIPVLPQEFHKTTSGKIQRNKFKTLFMDGYYKGFSEATSAHVPPLMLNGYYETSLKPLEVSLQMGRLRRKRIQIFEHSPSEMTALVRSFLTGQHDVVQENPGSVYFVLSLDQTYGQVDEASICVRLIHEVLRVFRSTHERSRFFVVLGVNPGEERCVTASLSGFVRTLASEHFERKPSLLVWDSSESGREQIIRALKSDDLFPAGEVHLREGGLFAPSLVRKTFLPKQQVTFAADSTYLISGGCGALGLALTGFLVSSGAQHIVLCSRSGETPSLIAQLAPLRLRAEVSVVRGDMSRKCDVDEVFRILSQSSKNSLKGVFHLAGVYEAVSVADLSLESLNKTFEGKVLGATLICDAVDRFGIQLDHLVFFSSISSILGTSGLAAYTAANAFLDTMARLRKGSVSIQWGPWDLADGMAGRENLSLFNRIKVLEGMASLGFLLQGNHRSNLALCNFDFTTLSLYAEGNPAAFPVLSSLVVEPSLDSIKSDLPVRTNFDVAASLREILMDVLGVSPSDHEDLIGLGLDSAKAMRLVAHIRGGLNANVPLSFVFKHPQLAALTKVVCDQRELSFRAPALEVPVFQNEPRLPFRPFSGPLGDLQKPIYLLGSGGHARTIISTLKALHIPIAGIYTNIVDHVNSSIMGVRVLGLLQDVPDPDDGYLHICLGQPVLKKTWSKMFSEHEFISIVHPSAIVDQSSIIGEGSFVGAFAVVEGLVSIGAHTIVEVHALVAHDCMIGSFTLVGGMAALSGATTVGDGVVIGTHASTAPKIRMGNRSVLGAGSSAHLDVPEDCTALGVPAEVTYVGIPITM